MVDRSRLSRTCNYGIYGGQFKKYTYSAVAGGSVRNSPGECIARVIGAYIPTGAFELFLPTMFYGSGRFGDSWEMVLSGN